MNTTITTDYKYHIYELVDGKWEYRPSQSTWVKSHAETNLKLKRIEHLTSTFKLVTEKITTVHEFMEESNSDMRDSS